MKKLIVANWKMTPLTASEAEKTFLETERAAGKMRKIDVAVCPPFVWLPVLNEIKRSRKKVALGSQDVFWENSSAGGSFTGEISPHMLKNLGVKYVIIGHSERRKHLGETDEMINKKIKAALRSGLKTILCVGEKERDASAEYLKFVKKEIVDGLTGVFRKNLKDLIIAYEPIWAISSTPRAKEDTPEDFFRMSIFIRRVLFSVFGKSAPEAVPILYGGSVDAENVSGFLKEGKADGVLVGRSSFKAETFVPLLKNTI